MSNLFLIVLSVTVMALLLGGCQNRVSSPNSISTDPNELSHVNERKTCAHCLKIADEISNKIKLEPISKSAVQNEFELRVWTNIGKFFEKLLVVRMSKNGASALFFDIDRSGESVKFKKTIIAEPRSGWARFTLAIKDKEIEVPLKLRFVESPTYSRDEGMILFQISDHGQYDSIFYGELTASVDGQKVFDWCDYLASEFDADLDCRGNHTSP